MRTSRLSSICLFLSLLGAKAKPVGWEAEDGSNIGFEPGFDWQYHQPMQAWSPDMLEHLDALQAHPPTQDIASHDHLSVSGTPPFHGVANGQGHFEAIDLDSPATSPHQEPGTDSAVSSPPAPGVSPGVEMEQARHAPVGPLEEWQRNLQEAFGNPLLVFAKARGTSWGPQKGRLYIARDPSDPGDWHSSSNVAARQQPLSRFGTGQPHFANSLKRVGRALAIPVEELGFRGDHKAGERALIWLDSRATTDTINRRYFLNNLRILPINAEKLARGLLHKMFTDRKVVLLLSPTEPGGMGLLMARHEPDSKRLQDMLEMTGQLENNEQIVSLWSPVLASGKRRVAVLYGIAQLDAEKVSKTLAHLDKLDRPNRADAVIDLKAHLHV